MTEPEEMPTESLIQISNFDIFLVTAVMGFGIYWFFYRKEEDDSNVVEFQIPSAKVSNRQSDEDACFISKMKKSNKTVAIFYGSQTGTAEEFANRLSKDAMRYGLKSLVLDPEECNMEDLSSLMEIENSVALFCMATYGEGDPTDNAQDFYDWLNQEECQLDGLKFAVFGLGNRTYEHYNSMGKSVDKKLEEYGGDRVYDLGLGDDDQNIEEDFVTWKEGLWPALCNRMGIEATASQATLRAYKVNLHDATLPADSVYRGEIARLHSYDNQRPQFDAKNPFLSPLSTNRELHHGGDRSCMHIEFNIEGSKLRYETGDHVAVYPTNDSVLIEKLGELLKINLDTIFSLDNIDEDSSKKHPFPCPTSYRTAFSHYLDINSPPRTNVFSELAEFCDAEEDKQLFKLLSSPTPEGKLKYQEWVMDARRTIIAVLEDAPSCHPTADHLCELLPRLQARYYSIASSAKKFPTSVHICALLVEYKTQSKRTNWGVATLYLKQKMPSAGINPKVPIFIRKSQFRLPFKLSHPILLVGPGTGLAPFMGFIQEREHHMLSGKDVGETTLFFGCRKEKEDYIYREDLEKWEKSKVLTNLFVAFSRDGPEKVYVQDLMRQKKSLVWNIINNHGHIYVCGDARHMARDVQNTITDIVEEFGGKTHQQAVDFVRGLMNKGRYNADVWS